MLFVWIKSAGKHASNPHLKSLDFEPPLNWINFFKKDWHGSGWWEFGRKPAGQTQHKVKQKMHRPNWPVEENRQLSPGQTPAAGYRKIIMITDDELSTLKGLIIFKSKRFLITFRYFRLAGWSAFPAIFFWKFNLNFFENFVNYPLVTNFWLLFTEIQTNSGTEQKC